MFQNICFSSHACHHEHELEDTLTSAISHYRSNQTACGCSLSSCIHIHCTFCNLTFRFSSGSPWSSLWSERAVTTCEQFPPSTSAFQVNGKKKKTLVTVNVICLYLLCWHTLPQLLSEQTSREAFECFLKWHEGHRAHEQPQGKVSTLSHKLVLMASEI